MHSMCRTNMKYRSTRFDEELCCCSIVQCLRKQNRSDPHIEKVVSNTFRPITSICVQKRCAYNTSTSIAFQHRFKIVHALVRISNATKFALNEMAHKTRNIEKRFDFNQHGSFEFHEFDTEKRLQSSQIESNTLVSPLEYPKMII